MRTGMMLVMCLCVLVLTTGCWEWLTKHGEEVEKVGETVKRVAPVLPPPFNWILGGIGTAAILVGGHFAHKSRQKAIEDGAEPGASSPLVKMFAERKFLLPMLGVLVTTLKATDILPLSGEELTGILTMLGVPTIAEAYRDAKAAGAKVDSIVASNPPQPPV